MNAHSTPYPSPREARERAITRSLLPALLLAAGLAAAAPARAWWPCDETWANGRLVDVQVKVEGQPATLFASPSGDQKRYVQAYAGRHYSLVLHNRSYERVGVLLTVDGLNVVNGERSSLGPGEAMYVLAPYETATIDGWRTSLDEVRRFVFVDERRSYAARTDQANGDMGWIRVLAFREYKPLAFWPDNRRFRPGDDALGGNARDESNAPKAQSAEPSPEAAPPAASAPMARAEGELRSDDAGGAARQLAKERSGGSFPGTGWGDRQQDHVERVDFRAMGVPTDHLVFRYEYASGLRELGLLPVNRDRLRDRENGELGFAKPPRW